MPSIRMSPFMYCPNLICRDFGDVFDPKGENLGGRAGNKSKFIYFRFMNRRICLSKVLNSEYLFLMMTPRGSGSSMADFLFEMLPFIEIK